jgi:ubiquinone/menaquinone biosynthesis C-methylase UbiE
MQEANADSIRTFYWDNFRKATIDRYLVERERAFIRRLLMGSTRRLQVLEVGCGSGRITLVLYAMGLNVVGLDIDPVALAAFQRQSNSIPLIMADAIRLPFSDSTFDCLVAIQCLRHLDCRSFLEECHRVLCKGGLLIVQALNRRSYKSMLRRALGCLGKPRISGYSLSTREVLDIAIEHGFEPRAVSGYNWVPFHRKSNSSLVWVAALIEQKLQLNRFHEISPWIIVAATRS